MFGQFTDCSDHATHGTVAGVVEDFAAQVGLPMVKDFAYGHIQGRRVLTCGVRYRLDAENGRLEQIEE